MKRIALVMGCALVAASGCTKPVSEPVQKVAVAPAYNTDISMDEVMVHVMNPAGYLFWSGWGVIDDKDGAHDLTPKNEAEWKRVEDGAATVVLTTNAIMLPGYARAPEAEWNRYAQDVARIAMLGKQAAERHDSKALGQIGEELDVACDACHAKFPPLAPPPKS